MAPPTSTSLADCWAAAGSALTASRSASVARVRIVVVMSAPEGWSGLLEAWIERVAQAVAEEVEAEHGDEDGQAGEQRQPHVGLDERHVGFQVPAPARRRRLSAQAQERQRRLHDDRGGDA